MVRQLCCHSEWPASGRTIEDHVFIRVALAALGLFQPVFENVFENITVADQGPTQQRARCSTVGVLERRFSCLPKTGTDVDSSAIACMTISDVSVRSLTTAISTAIDANAGSNSNRFLGVRPCRLRGRWLVGRVLPRTLSIQQKAWAGAYMCRTSWNWPWVSPTTKTGLPFEGATCRGHPFSAPM